MKLINTKKSIVFMRKKAAYSLFSLLVLLSSTFAVAPMAFCNMKAATPESSCCKLPVSSPIPECPVCADLNKLDPTPANISVKTQAVSQYFVTVLPQVVIHTSSQVLGVTDYSVNLYFDSSPPLYLQFGNFRL